ncbi:SpoIIE family protein phosphatase [Geodermatophilus sp. SYSU D00684]
MTLGGPPPLVGAELPDALVQVAPVGLAVVGPDLRIAWVNPAMAALATGTAGTGSSPLVGRGLREALGEAADAIGPACRQALTLQEPVTGLVVGGGRRLRPGASSCWRVGVHPLAAAGATGETVAVVVEDVTDLRRVQDRAAALQALTAELSGAVTLPEVLQVALERASAAVGGAAASIGILEPDGRWLRTITTGFPEQVAAGFARLPADASLPGPHVARTRRALFLPDRAAAAAAFPDAVAITDGTPYQAAAVQPLQLDDTAVGYLSVHFTESGEVDPADRDLLAGVARACAAAIDRARRGEAERAERELTRHLQALAGALAVASTVEEVAAILTRQTPALLGATLAIVGLYEPETRTFHLAQPTGNTPADIRTRFARWPLEAPLPSRDLVATGRPVLLRSLAERDRRYPAIAGVPVTEQAWAQLLLQVRGRPLGTVSFGWPEPRDFPPDEVERMQVIADLCAGALERARLADVQRQIAETLQRHLLPPRLPDLPGVRLAARYHPAGTAARAGGDWYDAFALPGDRIGLLTGDVAGHGVGAAGLMGQVRALARAQARDGADPGRVLAALNAAVCDLDAGDGSVFVTGCYVQLDPGGGRLSAASAGHLPPFLRPPGRPVTAVRVPPGLPLGVRPGARYATASSPLPAGSTVLLYTDGLVERPDRFIDDGIDALAARLDVAPEPVEELCDRLLDAVLADGAPADDIAMIAAQTWSGGPAAARRA